MQEGVWGSRGVLGYAVALLGAVGAVHCSGSHSSASTRPDNAAAGDGGAPDHGGGQPDAGGSENGGVPSEGGASAVAEVPGGAAGDELGGRGAGGVPTFACDPSEVKLREVDTEASSYPPSPTRMQVTYDEQGRLSDLLWDGDPWFGVGYDELGRVGSYLEEGEYGYSVDYLPSGAVRFTSDDQVSDNFYYVGRRITRRWTDGVHPYPAAAYAYDYLGLLSSITANAYTQQPGPTTTFTYEYDEHDHPIRTIPSVGSYHEPTTEVYDEAGRHLFQVVETAEGEPKRVLLFLNNQDPVRSLIRDHLPKSEVEPWVYADMDTGGSADVLQMHDPRRAAASIRGFPDFVASFNPISLTRDEVFDFDYDLDHDDSPDVSAHYDFDDEGRFTHFVLSLAGAPRVDLQVDYTPSLVTQTVAYPGSTQPSATRRFFYGCPDFALHSL